MSPSSSSPPPGLLTIPHLPGVAVDPGLARDLRGHVTSDDWLPQGLSDELDQIREEHLEARQVAWEAISSLHTLHEKFRLEDREDSRKVDQAVRLKKSIPDAKVTPTSDREDQIKRAQGVATLALRALADKIERARGVLVDNEADLLATLKARSVERQQEIDRLQVRVQQARSEQTFIAMQAQWLKRTAEGSGFGVAFPAVKREPTRYDPALNSENSFKRSLAEADQVQPVRTFTGNPAEDVDEDEVMVLGGDAA